MIQSVAKDPLSLYLAKRRQVVDAGVQVQEHFVLVLLLIQNR